MKHIRVIAIAGSAVAALLIAGCSSGESAPESSSAPAVVVSSAPAELASSAPAEASTAAPTSDDDAASDPDLMDVDAPALAAAIADAAGVPAEAITVYCPETYPNQVGHTFECGLNDGSKDFTVLITVTDLSGGVDFEITAEGLPD